MFNIAFFILYLYSCETLQINEIFYWLSMHSRIDIPKVNSLICKNYWFININNFLKWYFLKNSFSDELFNYLHFRGKHFLASSALYCSLKRTRSKRYIVGRFVVRISWNARLVLVAWKRVIKQHIGQRWWHKIKYTPEHIHTHTLRDTHKYLQPHEKFIKADC